MKRRREPFHKDHTETAFTVAAFAGWAAVIATEWIFYEASDTAFWETWRLHPISIFLGTLTFLCALYGLQLLNDRKQPLRYLQPYTPLLGASGIHLALKTNGLWLIPVAAISILWSVFQVRASRR